jgi:hypothetical protein
LINGDYKVGEHDHDKRVPLISATGSIHGKIVAQPVAGFEDHY